MEFQSEYSDFYPEEDEDEKRDKIKNMLKDLINESKQIIKENEKKCTEENEILQSLPKLPTGIKININRQKSTSKQQQNVIQPTIKKSFPDPFKFKTNLPAGIKIVKLNKSSIKTQDEIIEPTLDSIVPPPAVTSLEYIPKLPPAIKIVKLNKNQKIAEKPTVSLNNLLKLPPGIKVTQLKKAPVVLEEESDDDFTFDSDFQRESSPIIESPLVEIKCGVCKKSFDTLQLLENHSDCNKLETVKYLTVNSQILKLTEIKKLPFKRRVVPAKQAVKNLKKLEIKPPSPKSGLENQSDCNKMETIEYLTANSQMEKLSKENALTKLELKKNLISLQPKLMPKSAPPNPIKFVPKSWSEDCLKQFESCNHLNQHEIITVISHTKLPLSYVKCKICKAFHNNLDEMKEHISKGHTVKQFNLAKQHLTKIKKIKPKVGGKYIYICPLCDDVEFKTLKMYNNHIMKEHKTVEKFSCKICEKILLTEVAFNSHMTLAHFKIKKTHQCTHCDVGPFSSEDLLNNHIFTRHAEIDHRPIRNTCEICGKLFKKYERKKRHLIQVHTTDTNFVCDICGIAFKSTSELTHYRVHSERAFPCDQCDAKFRHKQDLIIHKRLHTGERPYECTICHERFVANSNLTKHLRSRHLVKTGILVE